MEKYPIGRDRGGVWQSGEDPEKWGKGVEKYIFMYIFFYTHT